MAVLEPRSGVGALSGPRVLGRLTPELILRSPQYMNCVGEYELDLRANRLVNIENLGATEVRNICVILGVWARELHTLLCSPLSFSVSLQRNADCVPASATLCRTSSRA